MAAPETDNLSARQRGDFQTPEELAREVWACLDTSRFDLVIEPTFGLGSFLRTMPRGYAGKVLGWEIHEEYYRATLEIIRDRVAPDRLRLFRGDVFSAAPGDLDATPDDEVLVIGNPPWVTNAEQGARGGGNTGGKRNIKKLAGLDAMTGKSNFDISEAIILHLIALLRGRCRSAQFALLTKFSVVRSLMSFLTPCRSVGDYEFHQIDAARHFGASVDAGLLKFRVGDNLGLRPACSIHAGIGGAKTGELGLVGGRMVYNLEGYTRTAFMESHGGGHYVWRQGVKHDLRRLMELSETGGVIRNGLDELVEIEEDVLYQLYKSSDIYHGRLSRFLVPIYQRDLKDTLDDLPVRFPKLYSYLTRHAEAFKARKSGIYKNRPPFSIFGVGSYTHLRYKVAVGALYAEPRFRLLEPAPRPVAVDDTSYALATDDYDEAVYLLAILSLECTRDFLCSISHPAEKRRFSKEVLARLRIPLMKDSPWALRAEIKRQWEHSRTFPSALQHQVQDWLSSYAPPLSDGQGVR